MSYRQSSNTDLISFLRAYTCIIINHRSSPQNFTSLSLSFSLIRSVARNGVLKELLDDDWVTLSVDVPHDLANEGHDGAWVSTCNLLDNLGIVLVCKNLGNGGFHFVGGGDSAHEAVLLSDLGRHA